MSRGDLNSAVFLDIHKAFDIVNYRILLHKLHCKSVWDGELLFFRSDLQNCTQCWTGLISTLQTVTSGVLQGYILGQLHFMIYNDLPAFIQEVSCSITMYADDTSLHKAFELVKEMIPAFSKVFK